MSNLCRNHQSIRPSLILHPSRKAAGNHNVEPIQTSDESTADRPSVHTKDATSTSSSYETSTQLDNPVVGFFLSDTRVPISHGQQPDPTINGAIKFTEVDPPAVTFGNSRLETQSRNMQSLTLDLPKQPSDTHRSMTLITDNLEPGISTSSYTSSVTDTSINQFHGTVQYSFGSLDEAQFAVLNTKTTVDTSPADIHLLEFMGGSTSEKEKVSTSTVLEINPSPYIKDWAHYAKKLQESVGYDSKILVISPSLDAPGSLTLDTTGSFTLSAPERHHITTTTSEDHFQTSPMITLSIENPIASATTDPRKTSTSPTRSTMDGSRLSKSITKEGLTSIFASVSGAAVLACCIIVFHGLCYDRLVRFKKRNRAIRKWQNRRSRNESLDTSQDEQLEISRFSADS